MSWPRPAAKLLPAQFLACSHLPSGMGKKSMKSKSDRLEGRDKGSLISEEKGKIQVHLHLTPPMNTYPASFRTMAANGWRSPPRPFFCSVLLLSLYLQALEHHFGHFMSAVPAVSPYYLLPSISLLTERSEGLSAWKREQFAVKTPFSTTKAIGVINSILYLLGCWNCLQI